MRWEGREGTDLEDRLKVERESVPERELSTRRSSEYSSCIRCPLWNERVPHQHLYEVARPPSLTLTILTGQRILFVDV